MSKEKKPLKAATEPKKLSELEAMQLNLFNAERREIALQAQNAQHRMEISKLKIELERFKTAPVQSEIVGIKTREKAKLVKQINFTQGLKKKYNLPEDKDLIYNSETLEIVPPEEEPEKK